MVSCNVKLALQCCIPTSITYIYHELVASAGSLWMRCDWWLWYMVTFRSLHWVSACSESADFIMQIWVKHHLPLKSKLNENTILSSCYFQETFLISGLAIIKILIPFIIHFTVFGVSNCNILDILISTGKTS